MGECGTRQCNHPARIGARHSLAFIMGRFYQIYALRARATPIGDRVPNQGESDQGPGPSATVGGDLLGLPCGIRRREGVASTPFHR